MASEFTFHCINVLFNVQYELSIFHKCLQWNSITQILNNRLITRKIHKSESPKNHHHNKKSHLEIMLHFFSLKLRKCLIFYFKKYRRKVSLSSNWCGGTEQSSNIEQWTINRPRDWLINVWLMEFGLCQFGPVVARHNTNRLGHISVWQNDRINEQNARKINCDSPILCLVVTQYFWTDKNEWKKNSLNFIISWQWASIRSYFHTNVSIG